MFSAKYYLLNKLLFVVACWTSVYTLFYLLISESAQNQSPYIFGATKPTIMCVKEGDTIILECAAFAKPAPKITWKKYGGHLLNIKKENSFASNVFFHRLIFILNIVFKKHQFIFLFCF